MVSSGLRRFSVLTACSALLLVVAGGLVTSNDAALSVPDWPLSYGKLVPQLEGGIRFEFAHRALAATVAVLTLVLAVWLARTEPRRWVRSLGWLAVAAANLAAPAPARPRSLNPSDSTISQYSVYIICIISEIIRNNCNIPEFQYTSGMRLVERSISWPPPSR